MYKIFLKRFFRYLKENAAILIAFFLLITFISIVIVCIQSSSQTIIQGHINNAENECKQDGQFTEFIPLTQNAIDALCADYNVQIQPIFSFDSNFGESSTIRFFKNRTQIDKAVFSEGTLPANDSEIVIDQLFAKHNNIHVGDKFTAAGREFTISGLATLLDYNRLLIKTTDASMDYNHFTWGILTDDCFDKIVKEDKASLDYTYDYILGEDTDYEAFKTALTSLEFDYVEYAKENQDFSNYLNDQISQYFEYGDLVSGVDQIVDGATQLSDGLDKVDTYSPTIKSGIEQVRNALVELENGGKSLTDNNDAINNGITNIYTTYSGVYDKFVEIKDKVLGVSSDVSALGTELAGTFAGTGFADKITELNGYIENYQTIINNTDTTLAGYKKDLATFKEGLASYTDGAVKITEGVKQLREALDTFSTEIDTYFNGITQLKDGANALKDGLTQFKTTVEAQIQSTIKSMISNTISVLPAEDNSRIGLDNYYAEMYYSFSFIIAPLCIALFALVFAIITKQQITKETQTIGSLFALGVGKGLMMAFYLVPTFIVTILGGIVGSLIGGSTLFMELPLGSFHTAQSLPYYEYVYPVISYIFGIVAPALVTLVINFFMLNKTFSRTAISLMRGVEPKVFYSRFRLKGFSFIRRFRIRQLLNDMIISLAVFVSIALSITFMLLGIDTYYMIENGRVQTDKQMNYNYIYAMQYPMSDLETTGEKVYIENLLADCNGRNVAVSIVGIEEGNRFIDAQPEKNAYSAVAGSGLATKMGVGVGDYIVLFDSGQEKNLAFRITDVVDSISSLQLYMDISSMRTLFGQTSKYYNAVISEEELDIDPALVYSVTTKESVMQSFDSQALSMTSFIYLALGAAIAIYLVVLYLIVGMLVDRNALGISLTRVLGYRGNEIRSLYIQGVSYIVIFSLIFSIPVGKVISDALSKSIYSKLPIGMDFSLPWYCYLAIVVFSLGTFAIILKLVIYKIRQINNTDILRSRL